MFTGRVVVTPIDDKNWSVVESFSYTGRTDTFVIPAGTKTDFASVPRPVVWLLPRYGHWTKAAILHDYLWSKCRVGEFNFYDADGLFKRSMRELGVPFWRRWIMWAAVRFAAPFSKGSSWKTWFERGPVPFLKMWLIAIPALSIVAVPALVVSVGLLAGAAIEWATYPLLRVFQRDESKAINQPELGDVLSAN